MQVVELQLPEPEAVPVPLSETENELLPEAVQERVGERVVEVEKDCSAEGVCEALLLTVRVALLQPVALLVPELQGEAVAQRLVLALVEGQRVVEGERLCVSEVVPLTLLDPQSVALPEAEGLPVFDTLPVTEPEAQAEIVLDKLLQTELLPLNELRVLGLTKLDCVVLTDKKEALATAERLALTVGESVLLPRPEGEGDGESVGESVLQSEVVGD